MTAEYDTLGAFPHGTAVEPFAGPHVEREPTKRTITGSSVLSSRGLSR